MCDDGATRAQPDQTMPQNLYMRPSPASFPSLYICLNAWPGAPCTLSHKMLSFIPRSQTKAQLIKEIAQLKQQYEAEKEGEQCFLSGYTILSLLLNT